MDPSRARHVPVLLDRVLALLDPALAGRPAVALDATLGLGGHAEALLAAHPQLTLIGLDRDPAALERSRERLAPHAGRIHLVHAVYDEIPDVLTDLGFDPARSLDAVLFDLGVSSMQLDVAGRGFAYAQDAPLDMRMDQSAGVTAETVVNEYPVPELARILREYGEERFALRVAQAIARARPVTSTAQLAELVRTAIPAATRRRGGHPAKRTFQALRIEVNGELAALRAAVPAALDALAVGGRIVVLSYHSLEDRIVKQALATLATDTTPPGLPVPLPEHGPRLRLLAHEGPGDDEVAANPRAQSVRLRAAERIAA